MRFFRLAVTGGIASGKSTFAQMLAQFGGVCIDHDQLARTVLCKGSVGLRAVTAEFGTQILDSQGELARKALAKIVFNDDTARKKLNAITHPLIEKAARAAEQAAAQENPQVILIHDIPLFVGSWLAQVADYRVLVTTPAEIRIYRMVHERKMHISEARARIAAQLSDAEIAQHVDLVVQNTGSLKQLHLQASKLWNEIIQMQRNSSQTKSQTKRT